MSASLDSLEASARLLIASVEKLKADHDRLERENKKLTDQLGDALDEVFRLQRELQAKAVKS